MSSAYFPYSGFRRNDEYWKASASQEKTKHPERLMKHSFSMGSRPRRQVACHSSSQERNYDHEDSPKPPTHPCRRRHSRAHRRLRRPLGSPFLLRLSFAGGERAESPSSLARMHRQGFNAIHIVLRTSSCGRIRWVTLPIQRLPPDWAIFSTGLDALSQSFRQSYFSFKPLLCSTAASLIWRSFSAHLRHCEVDFCQQCRRHLL